MRVHSSGDPPDADVVCGPGGYEHAMSRLEAQELSCSHRILEEVARNELEAMEREARHALFYQDHHFRFPVEEHQRSIREALCSACTSVLRKQLIHDGPRTSKSPGTTRRTIGK